MQIKAIEDRVALLRSTPSQDTAGFIEERIFLSIEEAEQLLADKILARVIFEAKRNSLEVRNRRITELKAELKKLEEMNIGLDKPFQL